MVFDKVTIRLSGQQIIEDDCADNWPEARDTQARGTEARAGGSEEEIMKLERVPLA